MKTIVHQLNLKNIGGVQTIFLNYIKNTNNKNSHMVFTKYDVDSEYSSLLNHIKIKKFSLCNLLFFIYTLVSNKYVNVFYNNIGSKQLNFFLKYFPVKNIILQERGRIWCMTDKEKDAYQYSIEQCDVVVANSNATKQMIEQRFGIVTDKIKVVYNGISNETDFCKKKLDTNRIIFGYIGRLTTHKGVHTLLETAKILEDNKKIEFIIAGNGHLEKYFIKHAKGLANVTFLGRVENPLDFYKQIDVLIVPSIREPLGNICIEAGFCRIPVIGSLVDGIYEILTDNENSILIKPDKEISLKEEDIPKEAPDIPLYVIDPLLNKISDAKELDPYKLKEEIVKLSNNIERIDIFGDKLYQSVTQKFSMKNYISTVEEIYEDF